MFEPIWLKTFLTVVQTLSFSEAARRLGLRQSTVSQHIRRLEETAGRRLFLRDTHSVRLTADGDAMVEFARGILEVNERAGRYFAGSELRGRLRFGTPEDFVLSGLPELLRSFTATHPSVDFELTVGLSGNLYEKLDQGELDLVFCKRRQGDDRGQLVRRDKLIWVGTEQTRLDPTKPLPVVVYQAPSITRAAALQALEQAGRSWRIVCTSASLSGLRAAVLAGLGVMAHARSLIPEGLVELPTAPHLPELGEVEFVVAGASKTVRGPAAELAAAILASGDRLRPKTAA